MQWFKWWDGTCDDPKLRIVSQQAGVSVAIVVAIWAYLLEKASTSTERGFIPESLDVELMAVILGIDESTIETVRNGMKRRGLVTETGEVAKWDDRQSKREKSEPSGASTERVKRYREKQKQNQNKDLGDGNGSNDAVTDETAGNGRKRPKRREEEEKNIKPKPSSSSGDDGVSVKPFDRFWEAWPNKVAKQAAQKAWAKLKPSPELVDTILAAIEAQKQGDAWCRDGGQYIGHPASWLNGGRWLDAVRPYVAPVPKQNHGRWWETKESMAAFGLTLTPPLKPLAGELPANFARRIQEALDRGDKPAAVAAPTPYVPPAPAGGESVLTAEQRKARSDELLAMVGSRKTQRESQQA